MKNTFITSIIVKASFVCLFLGIFVHTSCERETFSEEITVAEAREISQQFKPTAYVSFWEEAGLQVDWSSYVSFYWQEKEVQARIYPITIGKSKNKANVPEADYKIKEKYQLIAIPGAEEGTFTFYVAQFMQKHELDQQVSLDKVGDFNGSIYLYSFKGQEDLSKWYEYGTNIRNKLIAPPCLSNCGDNHGDGPNAGGDGGGRIILYTDHYTDWYKFEDGDWKFTHTVFSHRTEQVLFENNRSFNYYRGHKEYTPTQGGARSGGRVIGKVDAEKEEIKKIEARKRGAAWPYPHCSSWEYAQKGSIKGASVTGMRNVFFAYEVQSKGVATKTIIVNFPVLYFTMPQWMTNGHAATATAIAMEKAEKTVKEYFDKYPGSSEVKIENMYWEECRNEMKKIGGTVSTINSYGLRNPAPYRTDFFSTGNCN